MKNQDSLVKNIFFVLFLISIIPQYVIAEDYQVSLASIGKFTCKNTSPFFYNYDDIILVNELDDNATKSFDESFRKWITSYGGFYLIRGWNSDHGRDLFYYLSKNNFEYRVDIEDGWYFIGAKSQKGINLEEFAQKYYKFEEDAEDLRYALNYGIKTCFSILSPYL